MRILFIQYLQLGDVLMCTPALALARRTFPQAHIAFIVDPRAFPLVEHNPNIDRCIVASMRREPLAAQLRRLWEIRRGRYDVVVDFLCKVRSGTVALASGAPRRIAFARRGRRFFYTDAIPAPPNVRYRALKKCWLLKPLGIEPPATALPEIHTTDRDRAWAQEAWQQLGFAPDEMIAAISPVSKIPAKRWPAPSCVCVCRQLMHNHGLRILLLHGPREEDQIRSVAASLNGSGCAVAPFGTLRQFCALLARCTLFIGSDNGQRHIAMAAGIPTVGLFGSIDARHWTPPNDPRHRVVQASRDAIPTLPADQTPVSLISADSILAEVKALLDAGIAGRSPTSSTPAR